MKMQCCIDVSSILKYIESELSVIKTNSFHLKIVTDRQSSDLWDTNCTSEISFHFDLKNTVFLDFKSTLII